MCLRFGSRHRERGEKHTLESNFPIAVFEPYICKRFTERERTEYVRVCTWWEGTKGKNLQADSLLGVEPNSAAAQDPWYHDRSQNQELDA